LPGLRDQEALLRRPDPPPQVLRDPAPPPRGGRPRADGLLRGQVEPDLPPARAPGRGRSPAPPAGDREPQHPGPPPDAKGRLRLSEPAAAEVGRGAGRGPLVEP